MCHSQANNDKTEEFPTQESISTFLARFLRGWQTEERGRKEEEKRCIRVTERRVDGPGIGAAVLITCRAKNG